MTGTIAIGYWAWLLRTAGQVVCVCVCVSVSVCARRHPAHTLVHTCPPSPKPSPPPAPPRVPPCRKVQDYAPESSAGRQLLEARLLALEERAAAAQQDLLAILGALPAVMGGG